MKVSADCLVCDHELPRRTRLRRLVRYAGRTIGGAVCIYVVFLLLGFVPVNLHYVPPPPENSVRIFIRSNEVHTDLVLPTRHDGTGIDWRELFPPENFAADVRGDEHVALGWGNRQFYVETPRWADLKVSTVFGALFWPSESVLHVEYLPAAHVSGDAFRSVSMSPDQYRKLAAFVESSVARAPSDETAFGTSSAGTTAAHLATSVSYHSRDRFYESTGGYHLFNTCNQWTGRGLKRAGIPTGMWTPLKPHVLAWLPRDTIASSNE